MPIADPNRIGKLADRSEEINIIPNQWGVINQLGLFTDEPKTQKTVLIPRHIEEDTLIEDRNWDERNNTIRGPRRDVLPVMIPHYPVDDAITPNDVDGNLDWNAYMNGGMGAVSVDAVRAQKMETLRRTHANTLEYARAQILKNGIVYAPNGTVTTDFYTEFGVNREEVFFDLASTSDNPISKPEEVLSHIQDAVGGVGVVTDVVALASTTFFNDLISNAHVFESYQYFQQQQGPALLNGRLTADVHGLDARYRTFRYGGILFIEVRGQIAGNDYVESGKAYAFPLGTGLFKTYYAPANRFNTVNQQAMQSYYWEYMDEKNSIIEIMTETNFLNVPLRPDAVVTLNNASS